MSKVEEIENYFRETMGVGEGSITKAFNDSVSADDTNNMFTLAYQWQDKKHRHVRDLCSYVDALKEENEKLKAENEELNRQNRINGNAIKELRRALANIKELAIGFHLIDSEEAYKAMYLGKECYAAFFEDWILIESLKLNKFMLEINGTKEEGGFIIYVGELSDYLFREKEQLSDEQKDK